MKTDHRDVPKSGGVGFRRFGGGRFLCLEFDDVKQPPRIRWEDRDVGQTQSNASVKDGYLLAVPHDEIYLYRTPKATQTP